MHIHNVNSLARARALKRETFVFVRFAFLFFEAAYIGLICIDIILVSDTNFDVVKQTIIQRTLRKSGST